MGGGADFKIRGPYQNFGLWLILHVEGHEQFTSIECLSVRNDKTIFLLFPLHGQVMRLLLA